MMPPTIAHSPPTKVSKKFCPARARVAPVDIIAMTNIKLEKYMVQNAFGYTVR